MAEDRYEREERYGRRYGSSPRSERRGDEWSGDRRDRFYGSGDYPDRVSDYDRGFVRDWRTDDLEYPMDPRRHDSGVYSDWERYGQGGSRYGGRQEFYGRRRDFLDRAGDEVASWFGDEEAARRRQADQFRGKGPKGYTRSDERIEEDVNDRLTDDPWLDASEIDVSVAGGEVTLSGEVSSRADKRRAEDCADMVSGVAHVQNNLRVRSVTSAAVAPIDDLS